MAKKKLSFYEARLRSMIMQRRKVDSVEPWIEAQVEAAAMNWMMMANLHDEILKGDFLKYEKGSMGQSKMVVNPLLSTYRDAQRTHILNLEALGLNFKTQPKRMVDSGAIGADEDDPMMKFYKGLMNT